MKKIVLKSILIIFILVIFSLIFHVYKKNSLKVTKHETSTLVDVSSIIRQQQQEVLVLGRVGPYYKQSDGSYSKEKPVK